MWVKIAAALVFVIYTFSSVNAQGTLRDEVNANLTKMVQFVVHPSAKASKEIVDHALQMGGRPKTMLDRISYLNYIKDIARGVPEYMAAYTKNITHPNGTVGQQIDETAFDNAITNKAMEYSNRNKAQQPTPNPVPMVTRGMFGVQNGGMGAGTGSGFGMQNGGFFGNQFDLNTRPPVTNQPNFQPAADGSVSLFDLFNVVNFNNNNNMMGL